MRRKSMNSIKVFISGIFLGGILFTLIAVGPLGRKNGPLLPDEENSISVYNRCVHAVVNITAITLKANFFLEVYPEKGIGSGAIIDPQGIILTNNHVIGDAEQVHVTLADKATYPAKLIGSDPDSDLAILRIQAKGHSLTALTLGSANDLKVGQKVLAIGNPFGLSGSLSVGIISSLGRDLHTENNRTIRDVVQTDAAINPGNSGGPLLNSRGELIGVNAQIVSTSGGSEGVGFAISVRTVEHVIPQLLKFGEVRRPWLGASGFDLNAELLAALGIPSDHGVMLIQVSPMGPAAQCGLRGARRAGVYRLRTVPVDGDVLVAIGGTPVREFSDVLDAIADRRPGEKVALTYYRSGREKTCTMTLALSPRHKRRHLGSPRESEIDTENRSSGTPEVNPDSNKSKTPSSPTYEF